MKKAAKLLKWASLATCLFCVSMGTHAALVNFELTGDVQADFGSPFGLTAGDTILATGTFDDSVLLGGSGTISFADSINNFSIVVGSSIFTDDNVVMGGDAQLTLSASAFTGLDFTSTDNGGFVSIISTFTGGGNTLAGEWDAASFQMTPVPLPGAVWLFGSGLIGLAGFMRRRNRNS